MKLLLLSLLLNGYFYTSYSQNYSKFEPPDGRVIHGVGQYISHLYTNNENWQYVSEYQNGISHIPVLYCVYSAIDPVLNSLDETDFIDMVSNHGYPYVLFVGLMLHDSQSLNYNFNIPVQNILSGVLDPGIVNIAQRIKAINAPVYFRPGFEFGHNNSGVHSDPDMSAAEFKDIWIRIYNIFQQENVTNVAWVWNTVNPESFSYLDWYPGDEYVDWWGINYLTFGQISSGDNFLNHAAQHQKPVIICESCPIQNGGTTRSSNWNNWFVPYFNKISNNSNIKAFVYISDPWDRGPWASWPDSRITSNQTIRNNYTNKLMESMYIHMDEYQSNPALIDNSTDTTLPITLSMFNATYHSDDKILIEWKTESEVENIGYNIYRAVTDIENNDISSLDFIKLNEVIIPGAGSSSQSNEYTYLDENLPQLKYYYYYLEDVSYNGTTSTSDTLLVKMSIPDDYVVSFKNYPNPFNSSTIFEIQSPYLGDIKLDIFNILGEKVTTINQRSNTNKIEILWNAQNIASGVYIAKIEVTDVDESVPFNYKTQTLKLLLVK